MRRSAQLAFMLLVVATSEAQASKPNIIFLLADDLRYDALGCMGNPVVQTPAIDSLAKEGVRFRNAFVTTSICAVSRASFFSGQYARRHGINDFVTPFTPQAWSQTYPALLRQAGYRIGFIGKFGVGDAKAIAAMAKDFDYFKGLPGQAGLFFDPKDATKTHATAKFGNQAMEFLEGCDPNKPFCLSVSFNAPHARDGQPREFPPDLRDEAMYENVTIPMPPLTNDRFFQALPAFVQTSEGRKRWQKRFADAEMWQKTVRDYYRLITGVDREVGRMVAKLRERNMAENTLIVFTADNGFFLGDRGMADKWLMYEHSIRIPYIIFDPQLASSRRGTTVDAMVLNIDIAPTLLQYAGIAIPDKMQGNSLRPLLLGETTAWRDDWFYEHHTGVKIIPPSEGVRTKNAKYIRWMNTMPPVEELYDLEKDPLEERNLVKEPAHAAKLDDLRQKWRGYRESLP